MRTRFLVLAFAVVFSTVSIPTFCQDNNSSSQASNDNATIEGTVVSRSHNTLVVRSDDDQYHLFTYSRTALHSGTLAAGERVRVAAGAADENGTRDASDITILSAASDAGTAGKSRQTAPNKGFQAAPVPEQVRNVESDIRRESRRWRLGVRAGEAFNPELFTFGVQSQMGPIFHPRVLFRPNAEFAFGEVTDLVALNLEGIYRFSRKGERGNWTPYVGLGPSLNFIHQSYQQGRQISFGNFDYETGFNVLAGFAHRNGMFVELKSSLYSGPAPKLRLIFGYNF